MNTTPHPAVGRIGPYRAIHLSKILDPATEKSPLAAEQKTESLPATGREEKMKVNTEVRGRGTFT